jgi:hypothetical protein
MSSVKWGVFDLIAEITRQAVEGLSGDPQLLD